MTEFMNALQTELKDEKQLTENGAVGYATAGNPLLDFNFKIASYRSKDEDEIVRDFARVFDWNKELAMQMLFFAGDIRQGMGERKVFNACMAWLARIHTPYAAAVVPLIPEYTRWDYVVRLLGTACDETVWRLIEKQIAADVECLCKDKPVSLLGKWLPSVNASNAERNKLGKKIARRLSLKERDYRRLLVVLRDKIKVVERQMSANAWGDIDYNGVPSKANLLYKNAFLKHDEERRRDYLAKLTKGEEGVKINSSVAFPYDIVHSYMDCSGWSERIKALDATLEAMWKALPDYTKGCSTGGTICVVDGSGSMCSTIGGTRVTAHDVARSLGIYFSEKLTGPYKDKFITFSDKPKLVDLSAHDTLQGKIDRCMMETECSGTNIEATFDLILRTAVQHKLTQDQLPANILVISDMEFNSAIDGHRWTFDSCAFNSTMITLFEHIEQKYAQFGYKLPRMVFWNVNSRTCTVPVQTSPCGVALVSGFSPTVASMVFSNKLDPLEVLVDELNSERYAPVKKALSGIK